MCLSRQMKLFLNKLNMIYLKDYDFRFQIHGAIDHYTLAIYCLVYIINIQKLFLKNPINISGLCVQILAKFTKNSDFKILDPFKNSSLSQFKNSELSILVFLSNSLIIRLIFIQNFINNY